jgi:hypothetical protein
MHRLCYLYSSNQFLKHLCGEVLPLAEPAGIMIKSGYPDILLSSGSSFDLQSVGP